MKQQKEADADLDLTVAGTAAAKATSVSVPPTSTIPQGSAATVVNYYVLRPEVVWTLKVVMSHHSFNSCSDLNKVFPKMLPDSQIAKHFSCDATKCTYFVCFGLSPYFYDLLVDRVRSADCYSISFDECMNPVSQNEQMDFIVRFWDIDTNQVAVNCLGSQFLGHAKATDLLIHFKEGKEELNPNHLLQVSMDGPNVNWKFHRDLLQERKTEELPELLNIGSCGLHTVHGRLQKAVHESGWHLGNLLRSVWQIFHDTPARREDFAQVTGNTLYPLQFCQHRWVEDAKVAERAV